MLSTILVIVGLVAIAALVYSAVDQLSKSSRKGQNNEDYNHKLTRDKAAAMHAHMVHTHRIR